MDLQDRGHRVLDWFEPSKPYRIADPQLKLEDADFAGGDDGKKMSELAALNCFAVADKRYALFNLPIHPSAHRLDLPWITCEPSRTIGS